MADNIYLALGYLPNSKQNGESNINKEREKGMGIFNRPVSTNQITNNNQRQSIVNNNNSVSVHSSGAITEKSAPGIGGILASSLSFNAKTL